MNGDGLTGEGTPMADRLTEPQRRHLAEMLNSKTGETLYWRPTGAGEQRCAKALQRLGFLAGSCITSSDAYYLSKAGMGMARSLCGFQR